MQKSVDSSRFIAPLMILNSRDTQNKAKLLCRTRQVWRSRTFFFKLWRLAKILNNNDVSVSPWHRYQVKNDLISLNVLKALTSIFLLFYKVLNTQHISTTSTNWMPGRDFQKKRRKFYFQFYFKRGFFIWNWHACEVPRKILTMLLISFLGTSS